MMLFYVYIEKHVSKAVMRYGVYTSFYDAAEAVKHVKSLNTIDEVYIEEKHTSLKGKELANLLGMV